MRVVLFTQNKQALSFILKCCFILTAFLPNTLFSGNTGNHSSFRENKGQVADQHGQPNSEVLYLYSSGDLRIQLRKSGFSYELSSTAGALPDFQPLKKSMAMAALPGTKIRNHRVDFDFVNSHPAMQVTAEGAGASLDNYYLDGKEITNVRSYSRVTYKNVYPHTDIEFVLQEGTGDRFKYNVILHPGADLAAVKFALSGFSGLVINEQGDLQAETGLGVLSETIPLSYYTSDPNKNIATHFKLASNIVSFDAAYDTTKTLVIDPVMNRVWGTYLGDSNIEFCFAAGSSSLNEVYVCGESNSIANIATAGTHQSTLSAGLDAYVVKYDANGVKLWGSYFGGAGFDVFHALYVEPDGTVYLCGDCSSQANVASSGAHQTTYGGGVDDAILAKFSASGQRLWSTYYGGSQHDIAQAITVDRSGDVIITGHTESTSGISTPGAYRTFYNLNYDVFIAKFSPAGTRLWGSYYGDSDVDEAYGITSDAADNIIVTGGTKSISDIATSASHQLNNGGDQDAFISKFNAAGTTLIWGTYYGGSGSDFGSDVEIDSAGTIFVTGVTSSSNAISTPGVYQAAPGNNDDSFLAAFTPGGTRKWCTYFGGEDTDYINALEIDENNNLFICGSTLSSSLISTAGAWQPSLAAVNFYDAFFARFSNSGAILLSSYYGGNGNDNAKGMALNPFGKLYLAGETTSSVSISTTLSQMPAYAGSMDAFVVKFCVPFKPKIIPAGTTTICAGTSSLMANAQSYSTCVWNNTLTGNPLVVNATTVAGTYSFFVEMTDNFGCGGRSDTTVLVAKKCSTGLLEQEEQSNVLLYPNPAGNYLTLELPAEKGNPEIYQLEIISVLGQTILKTKCPGDKMTFDTKELAPGVYFLRIKTRDSFIEKKFLKD